MPNIAIQHWTFQVEIALGRSNFVKIKQEYWLYKNQSKIANASET